MCAQFSAILGTVGSEQFEVLDNFFSFLRKGKAIDFSALYNESLLLLTAEANISPVSIF